MSDQLTPPNPAGNVDATLPVGFIAACVLAFVASVAATSHFCRAMCCEMNMPGGWTMSMMWLRMSGRTWPGSALGFLLMWLPMMVAMMLPSALPTFLKTRRAPFSLSVVAAGYFAVWLAFGLEVYALGVAFGAAAMRWEHFSRAVPGLSGAALIAVGAFQFTRWKMNGLRRCRSLFGCAGLGHEGDSNFRLGCQQGAACCLCCAGPMLLQIILGMMNPLVMILVTIIIAGEKILPRPEIMARLAGLAAILAGSVTVIHQFNQ